ncbi:YbaK/EbsC family protein [Egicoccus sp. AB-alg6-2]|uniref:YbaK/EbsC family protein n=1 Tax=Egicoccus sp. AB-alg6-2 TaxID=3242692 RepID=UPI00359DEE78
MATAARRFTDAAAAHGLHLEVREFPQGTRTAADAAAAIGCEVAQIVKSLVFMADDEPVLVLTSGANRVDERRVRTALGAATCRKANADEVRATTGYAIGGTPPFGHVRPLRVLCDRDLTGHDRIWAAAGTPSTVFPLTPRTLLEVTGADVVEVAV